MNKERLAYAIIMTLGGILAAAQQADAFSPKAAVWITLAAAGVTGFLRVLWPTPPTLKGTGDAP